MEIRHERFSTPEFRALRDAAALDAMLNHRAS
jgi:hypothetical protein